MNIQYHIFIIACVLALNSKAEPPVSRSTGKSETPAFLKKAEVIKVVSERHAAGKTVVFQSRDGKFYGMDSDSVISLELEGNVIVGEYGYTYQGYRGKFQVADDGMISIVLKGYPGKWPEMMMTKERREIWLYAKNGDRGFVFGGRGGAVEMGDMKSFWPFRLVEVNSTPTVTPIWTGGDVRSFTSPELPQDFKWQGERISFRLDFILSPEGKASVEKHWTHEVKSGKYGTGDWRLPAATSAIKAMEGWHFYPHRKDGKPVQMGRHWNFTLSRVGDMVRWVVQDDVVTVFDNMPREPNNP